MIEFKELHELFMPSSDFKREDEILEEIDKIFVGLAKNINPRTLSKKDFPLLIVWK